MKNFLILLLIIFSTNTIFSQIQKIPQIPYYNWSNPITFNAGKSPIDTGYGFYSDSLSKAHGDSTFYVYNDEYYPIETWADYYRWYINKYWYNFTDPTLYEYYYIIKDDYGMASYIANNFNCNKKIRRPFRILFDELPDKENTLYASLKNTNTNTKISKNKSKHNVSDKKKQQYKHISDNFNKNSKVHAGNIKQPVSFKKFSNNFNRSKVYSNKSNLKGNSYSKSYSSYGSSGVRSSSGGGFSGNSSSGSGSVSRSSSIKSSGSRVK